MALEVGVRLGPYEILSALGAGGMGEVYRAKDTKLDRDVAIKVLPELFVADPERVARFQREAKTLAALNHPHIGGIYGLEDAGGVRALVLELVEGPTLADRIAQGSIPLDEALPIAKQIAEALEAAHEAGIIHRDLKPANIKLRPDGTVKVLDFGLAKAMEPVGGAPNVTQSPTITTPAMMTGVGMILGTAAYMSPEQAKGRPADKRGDVWAFGCVLFEMLTGRRAFEGEDVSDTLAAVLRGEPDWSSLPATLPSAVRRVLKGCLEKDRRTRIPEIAVARFLLDERVQPTATAPKRGPRTAVIAAAGIVIVIAAAVGGWVLKPATVPSARRPVRFTLAAVGPRQFGTASPFRDLAMSWDGTRIVYSVYTGPTDGQLVIRNLDRLDVTPLAVQPATAPFESPDGRWIGYLMSASSELRKVALAGGPSVSLCHITGALRGASWGPNNRIVFGSTDPATGLLSVSGDGGDPTALTIPDTKSGELDHIFPMVLPSGDAVLFTITTGNSIDDSQVAVLDLKTRRYKTLIRGARQAEYVRNGYLVYGTGFSLRAIRFDAERLEIAGEAVSVVDEVLTKPVGGQMDFSVSPAGALAYVPGRLGAFGLLGQQRSLVWVDRNGREQPIDAPPRAYTYARLSPDGSRIALDIRDQEQDIWTYEIARGTLTRLTINPAPDVSPFWTPDGRHIVYTSSIDGPYNLFWQLADGSGAAERLATSPVNQVPSSISPDGSRLIFFEPGAQTGNDLMTLRLDGKSRPEPLLRTQFNEGNGDVSPDGRWLLYQSNESGHFDVYVRPYPEVGAGRVQVSNGGGERPMWSRNGREIFYIDANGFLTSVAVETSPTFSAGRPKKVFETKYFSAIGSGSSGRTYDVSRDGQRFLIIKELATGPPPPTPNLVVVLNLAEELKVRVPTK